MPVVAQIAVPAPKPRRKPQRAARTAPAADIERVRTWAEQALIDRSGATLAAGDVYASFMIDTGHQMTLAAFGAAMAALGCQKSKKGRIRYLDIAFRQPLRLAAGGEGMRAQI